LEEYHPHDGYDYDNAGEPPEGVATNTDAHLTVPMIGDPQSHEHTSEVSLLEGSGESTQDLDRPRPKIGRRELRGWRAKMPLDLEQGISGANVGQMPLTTTTVNAANGSLQNKPQTKTNQSAREHTMQAEALKMKTMEIMLHWKKMSTDSDKEFVLNITKNTDDAVREDHLVWQYVPSMPIFGATLI